MRNEELVERASLREHSRVSTEPSRSERVSGDDLSGRDDAETCGQCATLLATAGPVAVLGFLNARTRFRFTGLYRAEPPLLRNLHLFDRENPRINVSGAESPLEETYCAITCAGAQPFTTSDAQADARLGTHPARDSILSYGGVPIRLESGMVCGTLCHFDVRPRILHPREIDILEGVAPLFAPLFAALVGRRGSSA